MSLATERSMARLASIEEAEGQAARAFYCERVEGGAGLAALIEKTAGARTAFQTAAWLSPLFDVLAPATNVRPFGLVVRDKANGEIALILPLVMQREGSLEVARFPDLGVSDYCAPVLGPAVPTDSAGAGALWRAVLTGLDGADLVDLDLMPAEISGRPNPLASLSLAKASRHAAHALSISGTVEELLKARGRKYRKEAERSFRLLAKEGPYEFRRAETPEEIGRAFAALEAQQGARSEALAGDYVLERPEYSRFYDAVLNGGSQSGFAHIFTLTSGNEIIAVLMGVSHEGTFTLLRIANAGDRWRAVSPGRLIVIEMMRYFVARGVRSIDMGIGTYTFKERFGAQSVPLRHIVAPLSWKAVPRFVYTRAKARLRQSPELQALAKRVRGHH